MIPIHVKIKLTREGAKLPAYATEGSAACDLSACIKAPITLYPGERTRIPTGIAISIPQGTVAIVCARSGIALKRGLTLSNGIGVIDSDYRGEISVVLRNVSDTPQTVEPDERIAQLMFMPHFTAIIEECHELDETERGEGGFGSTGRT